VKRIVRSRGQKKKNTPKKNDFGAGTGTVFGFPPGRKREGGKSLKNHTPLGGERLGEGTTWRPTDKEKGYKNRPMGGGDFEKKGKKKRGSRRSSTRKGKGFSELERGSCQKKKKKKVRSTGESKRATKER